ncbi:hypothetical protein NFI96_002177 [Prochilodus magdalenae]|nr:hypothetical protein NFI96_002177 [Prochilodus magdalenae]
MGKREDLSDFDRGQIVVARRLGQSISQTAKLVGCSRSAVANTYRKWCVEGQTTSRRRGVGRPRLIDARGQQMLSHLVQADRRPTVAQVTEIFNDGYERNVSQHTVHRTLLRMGLRSRRPSGAAMPARRQKRLQWVLEHQGWTLEQWKKVAWSSKSIFHLQDVDGQVCVLRLPGDVRSPDCTVGQIKDGGESVTLWAMFCWETLGPIIHVDVGLTCATYLNVVADQVHPFMVMVFPDGSGIFQQNNEPCHTAHVVQERLEEHGKQFSVLSWPPNSPDLNPIEHLWDVLEQQIQAAASPPRSSQDLKDLLLTAWSQIPQDTFRALVESMPQRVEAVLEAHGGPTEY